MIKTEDLYGKIIIAGALDWGMGHLTRLTKILQNISPKQLILVATKDQIAYYKNHFPEANYLEIDPLNWQWSGKKNALTELWKQRKKWRKSIISDRFLIENYLKNNHVDYILSDNRYGLYSQKVPSIIITHQLNVSIHKPFGFLAQILLKKYLNPFQSIWVPDFEQTSLSLSSKLSRNKNFNTLYINPVERFKWESEHNKKDILLLLTGPEPQRKKFLLDFLKIFCAPTKKVFIVSPKTYPDICLSENMSWITNPDEKTLQTLLQNTKVIISRSGYTTIMEIFKLENCMKILIPTPKQKEQEYLGKYLNGKYGFKTINQKNIKELSSLIQ